MKRIKILIFAVICLLLAPGLVNASSANISVSGSSSAVVGNQITVTVTLSSSSKMGSWALHLNYDQSMLKLNSSSAENNGNYMVNSSSGGTKSKSYTFKFTALKSGSTKISTGSAEVYDFETMDAMSVSNGSKNIKIMTQAELEATYSSDASLKSLGVEGYTITPEFKKDVYEYSLEVENEIEKVTVNASKNDSNASVSGSGEITLVEGLNKVEVEVVAQKGNKQTYVINITRKELNPIYVELDGKQLAIIRRTDMMPEITGYEVTNVTYGEDEVPALFSAATNIILIALKDEEGNIYTYIYQDEKITNKYYEVLSAQLKIYPLELKTSDAFSSYLVKEIEINGNKVKAYALKDNSNMVVVYGKNLDTNVESYYQYDISNNVFQEYSSELNDYYQELIKTYKYVIYGLLGFILLLFMIVLFKKPKTKKLAPVEPVDTDEIKEIELPKREENNNNKKNKKRELNDDTVQVSKTDILNVFNDVEEEKSNTVEVTPIEEISKKDKKKLIKEERRAEKLRKKEEKRLAKEEKRRLNDFDF